MADDWDKVTYLRKSTSSKPPRDAASINAAAAKGQIEVSRKSDTFPSNLQ